MCSVKPANIFLQLDCQGSVASAHLGDWGLARFTAAHQLRMLTNETEAGEPGALPAYNGLLASAVCKLHLEQGCGCSKYLVQHT